MTADHPEQMDPDARGSDPLADPDDKAPPAPISFKIMVGLAVIYLGFRLVEGLVWLIDRMF